MAPARLRAATPRARSSRGIALITAMLIAALVTAGAVALAIGQQFDTRRIANILASDRAVLAIEGLEQAAIAALRDDAKGSRHDALDEAWRRTHFTQRHGDLLLEGRLRDLQGRFNLTNLSPEPRFAGDLGAAGDSAPPTGENPAPGPAGESAPDGATTAAVGRSPADNAAVDVPRPDPQSLALPSATGTPGAAAGESGAPGTATAPGDPAAAQAGQQGEQQLRLLFKALELDPVPVQAILDWIDPDTDTRFPNGAEDDYYTEQSPAYRAANRPFLSPRELLLVKGVSEEMYRRLAPFVVCLPQASRINVNTARKEVLMSLAPTIDSSTAAIILRARKTQPFLALDAFVRHPLLQFRQIPEASLAVTSEYFELRSVARNERQDMRLSSLIRRNGGEAATLRRWRQNFDD